ncbi:LysR substrate-binding domain-containing protein (plasmid) [Variovorax sp. V59]|uniref:DNA-binding transcriptional LysR family regulator n=2 Tax=Variovorax TaxID=34072 RepID=A0AAE3Y0M4_VARPD|nr:MULTISPECIES: LysR substrate-binding domain-containing protein [Variovorax]MBD9667857.1 LysR family transcriptional regulator [Variovorax sp. VRV01]MDP9964420.1 DNA-binding transcriptional LysR family regulator [Variovorax paradoxus]MDR6427350.1 DNA-binding transcriptional LysR family regulator [Variovorax paradoxus]MDR6454511.1 DNA-binding transcriptional LysR family regulator [Variovorax paradoxus]TWD85592.1 DNA-binding transcriptional LysR family regulator [Variovorax beijingensis]
MAAPDFRTLRYFVAVAEERSVGKAARRLNMAQPPLSVHIKNLEAAVGTPLFRRAARGMEITDAGNALFQRAKEALLLANEGFDAARAIGSGRRGRLTIGTMVVLSYLVLPRLENALRAKLPDVEVQYVELNALNNVSALVDSDVSVAICIPPVAQAGIAVERIGTQPLMLAMHADSPLARMSSIPLERLSGLPLIGLPVPDGDVDKSVVASMLRRHGVSMPIAQRVETMMSALALVLAGKGVAILPACARIGRPPGVVFRALRNVDAKMDIAACWRSDWQSPLIEPFLACARASVRQAA